MNNYFFLELDTTGPQITLYAPDYTGLDYCPVRVEGDELLDSTLDLYVVDSKGNRFDAIISHQGTYFEGSIPFHSLAPGIATIHARARDTVFNQSNVAEKTILVYGQDEVKSLKIETAETALVIVDSEGSLEIELGKSLSFIESDSLGPNTLLVVGAFPVLSQIVAAEIEARSDLMQYQFGNTVKLEAYFKDFDGNPVDPSNIKLVVYDSKLSVIATIPVTSENRVELGHYFYLYTLPSGTNPKVIHYEWYAEIQGSPTVKRETLKLVFV